MSRPGYLHNRRAVIVRSYDRPRDQRFFSYWTNPYGTESHEGYHAFWVTALLGALIRKATAEFAHWQAERGDRTWDIP